MYKFNGKKYCTSGIQNSVPVETQMFLWDLIYKMFEEYETLDYLQVFQLSIRESNGKTYQHIVHTQEQPPYRHTYEIETITALNDKIFVIDDVEHITMLFASEY